jgi:hypothetical protein
MDKLIKKVWIIEINSSNYPELIPFKHVDVRVMGLNFV